MLNRLTTFFVLSVLCLSLGCTDKECNASAPDNEAFVFRLLNKVSRTNLIALWGARYDSELVDLLEDDGSRAKWLYVGADGNISFVIAEDSFEALEREITKTYFLHLPDIFGTPSRDIDTLQFIYKFVNQDDCPPIWYDRFQVFFNDSLYHDGEYVTLIEFLK